MYMFISYIAIKKNSYSCAQALFILFTSICVLVDVNERKVVKIILSPVTRFQGNTDLNYEKFHQSGKRKTLVKSNSKPIRIAGTKNGLQPFVKK